MSIVRKPDVVGREGRRREMLCSWCRWHVRAPGWNVIGQCAAPQFADPGVWEFWHVGDGFSFSFKVHADRHGTQTAVVEVSKRMTSWQIIGLLIQVVIQSHPNPPILPRESRNVNCIINKRPPASTQTRSCPNHQHGESGTCCRSRKVAKSKQNISKNQITPL